MATAKLRQGRVIPDILVIHRCGNPQVRSTSERTQNIRPTYNENPTWSERPVPPNPDTDSPHNSPQGGAGAGYPPDNLQLLRFRPAVLGT